jgi:trypsin
MFPSRALRRCSIAGGMLLLTACGPSALDEPSPPKSLASAGQDIVNGTNATIQDNPWQVSLQDSSGAHQCGGSVINASWVLTAQHCVFTPLARVAAGSATLSGMSASGQLRSVAQVVVYPGFTDATAGRDIALLRLSTPLDLSGPSVKAIGLVTSDDAASGVTAPGVAARVTGWGALYKLGPSPDTLQTADVSILSSAVAQQAYPDITLTADQLSTTTPNRGPCQGDSGGPLTVLKNGTRVLAGVVSWGRSCGSPQYPGQYARVSTYASWITQKTNTAPLYSYTLYNPYFSGTYMYLNPNNDSVSLFLNKDSTFTVCAREGSVSGGPFTQGTRCG